jgi:ribosomal protein S18 acetylase RimI-like enzyme
MTDITIRALEEAPTLELAELQRQAFMDYVPSEPLALVLASEAASRPQEPWSTAGKFGVAAFREETLVGWTQGYRQGTSQFYMLNSGVAASERRRGVYSALVRATLTHAETSGYSTVGSQHIGTNAAVIIAKLKLGFQISGFEYSEVHGPLVRLVYLVGLPRRELYKLRASPIRAAE